MLDFFIILLMLVLSAFFSGSEIAFISANRLRVEVLARRGGMVSEAVRSFMDNPAAFLTTTLVGNNISLVVYSTLVAFYLDAPLESFYTQLIGIEDSTLHVAVLTTQTVIASIVVLFFGEILPKSIMRELANEVVFVLALPLRFTYYLLLPMIKVTGWTATQLTRMIRSDAATFSQFLRQDFELMIEESRESGELDLDEEESEILSNVFALNNMRVKESMTPRTDIVALEENTSLEDLRKTCIKTGFSKVPVYRENIDNILGIAFAYDLFENPPSLQEMMRPVKFIPESKLSKDLLQEFLATDTSIAVVIDEYGGTAGLVTREDLLEELFGDIRDEFDAEETMMRQVDAHTFLLSGRSKIDEINERFMLELPEGEYETIAGYLINRLGSIPAAKEEIALDNLRLVVLQSTANRIDLIRVTIT